MHAPQNRDERFRSNHHEKATRRFRQRTEATRERDVIKHLQPWTDMYHPSTFSSWPFALSENRSSLTPEPCKDTALLAFAQLVALRLGYRRSFVSLLSTSTEYVLAEATQTMSFQYASVTVEEDRPWIGTCTLPRNDGLGSLAIDTWRSARHAREEPLEWDHYYTSGLSPHWHIISDIRHNTDCQAKAFAKHAAWGRFYFAVPLRTAQGSIIGSLTVMDDRPRYGVSSEELSFVEDIADTITEHLHSTVVRSQRQRSEKLIQALGLFNRGEDSLRDWWLVEKDTELFNAGRRAENVISHEDREALGDVEFGARSTSFHARDGTNSSTDSTRYNSANSDDARSTTKDGSIDRPRKRAKGSRSGSFNLADVTRKTYARASNLIREALAAHGVAFVDISTISSALNQHDSSQSDQQSSANETSQTHDSSEAERSDSTIENRATCKVYGSSLRQGEPSGEDGFATGRLDFAETYLQHLIKRYPRGHVFNFGESGGLISSGDGDSVSSGSDQAAGKVRDKRGYGRRLRSVMANARTIAFYPLQDDTSGRWRSGVFVWSTSPLRVFDEQEDLTYLSAFGHSLMAELSRVETLAADKAKETFISSISHELRSPLHGVLAGVEFLQETQLSQFQQEMSHTILKAGRTLLDTINHLLDYSKISHFSSSQRRRRVRVDAIRHKAGIDADPNEIGVTHSVDLAQLTEDLVETVVSAHRFQHQPLQSPFSSNTTPGLDQSVSRKLPIQALGIENVSIALSIQYRPNWCVEIQSGSWTRIVTNLVGNALKYTEKGTISVSLGGGEPVGDSTADTHPLSLIVEDSGIGMSSTFLENDLYTPFKQEDSHSTGTGLGLSIVKQIAKELGAQLKVTSEVGRGTRVELTFRPKFVDSPQVSSSPDDGDTWAKDSRNLGFKVVRHIDVDQDGKNKFNANHAEVLDPVLKSVLKTCEDWLGCKIVRGSEAALSDKAVVYTITEQDVVRLCESGSASFPDIMDILAIQDASLLVLGGSIRLMSVENVFDGYGIKPTYVHSPIGPRKLIRAAMFGRDLVRSLRSPGPALSEDSALDEGAIPNRGTFGMPDSFPQSSSVSRVPDKLLTSKVATRPHPQRWSKSSYQRSQVLETTPVITGALESSSGPISLKTWDSSAAKVLMLVEDNEINMKLLVALMEKMKLLYKCAVNGREALDLYRKSPTSFSLILMDLSMPVMDGYTSAAKIRTLEKELQLPQTTIVALTGVTNEESKQRAFGSGVDEYYTKPVHMKDIKKLVEAAQKLPS